MTDIRGELNKHADEPLLPIGKKLISWGLGIGVVLPIVLTIINRLFPVA